MRVDDADGLETTLARIRQRYALHFLAPPGSKEERNIEVALAGAARSRYPDAEIRYRRTYLAPRGVSSGESAETPPPLNPDSGSKRRRAVNDVHDGPNIGPAHTQDPPNVQPAPLP